MLSMGMIVSKTNNNNFCRAQLTAVTPFVKADMIQNRFWLCCLHVRMRSYLQLLFCKHLTKARNFNGRQCLFKNYNTVLILIEIIAVH